MVEKKLKKHLNIYIIQLKQNRTNLPSRYFTRDLFNELINKSDLKIIKSVDGQKYYKWFFLFFNNPKFHFISLLKKNDK